MVTKTASIAVFNAKMNGDELDPAVRTFLDDVGLDKITLKDHDAFDHISNISHLIYATSVLDTFLSGTTKFLVASYPSAVMKEAVASYGEIGNFESIHEIQNHMLDRKVRAISLKSFLERIRYLKTNFGLKVKLDDGERENLTHFSGIRNTVAHDQSHMAVEIGAAGSIKLVAKRCALHPQHVSDDDIIQSMRVYLAVCGKLYTAVVEQVIKYDNEEKSEQFRELFGILGA